MFSLQKKVNQRTELPSEKSPSCRTLQLEPAQAAKVNLSFFSHLHRATDFCSHPHTLHAEKPSSDCVWAPSITEVNTESASLYSTGALCSVGSPHCSGSRVQQLDRACCGGGLCAVGQPKSHFVFSSPSWDRKAKWKSGSHFSNISGAPSLPSACRNISQEVNPVFNALF